MKKKKYFKIKNYIKIPVKMIINDEFSIMNNLLSYVVVAVYLFRCISFCELFQLFFAADNGHAPLYRGTNPAKTTSYVVACISLIKRSGQGVFMPLMPTKEKVKNEKRE